MFKYFFKFMFITFIIVCLASIFSTYIIKQSKETFETEAFPKLSDILNEIDKGVIETDEDFITQSVEVENMTKKFISTLGTFRKKISSYLKKNKHKFIDIDEENEEEKYTIPKKSITKKTKFVNEEDSVLNEEAEMDEENELTEENESIQEESAYKNDDMEEQIEGFICDSVASYEEYN